MTLGERVLTDADCKAIISKFHVKSVWSRMSAGEHLILNGIADSLNRGVPMNDLKREQIARMVGRYL